MLAALLRHREGYEAFLSPASKVGGQLLAELDIAKNRTFNSRREASDRLPVLAERSG